MALIRMRLGLLAGWRWMGDFAKSGADLRPVWPEWGLALNNSANHGGEDLDRRIAETEAKHVPTPPSAEERAENQGWAMGVDFVGVVLISAFIGWAIDRWAGGAGVWTGPWAMIVFLLLGFAAGVRNVMRLSKSDAGPADGTVTKPANPAALYDDEDD